MLINESYYGEWHVKSCTRQDFTLGPRITPIYHSGAAFRY